MEPRARARGYGGLQPKRSSVTTRSAKLHAGETGVVKVLIDQGGLDTRLTGGLFSQFYKPSSHVQNVCASSIVPA